jgi:CHAD domain-containing protein
LTVPTAVARNAPGRSRAVRAEATAPDPPVLLDGATLPVTERGPTVEREARAIAGHPDPSPERLHRFHRNLRRLRVELRLLRHVLGATEQLRAEDLGRRLKRVARLVGEVRDFDVELALLGHPRLARASDPSFEHLERTRGRLREEARTGRALLGAFLRAELDRGLVREIDHILAAAQPHLTLRGVLRAAAIERKRSRERAERALRRARRRPTPRRMHNLRSALRQAHHLNDLLAVPGHGPVRPFPRRVDRLQQELGRLHDLDVLADGLESLGPEVWRSQWARVERRRRRKLREEIASDLDRRTVRDSVSGLFE